MSTTSSNRSPTPSRTSKKGGSVSFAANDFRCDILEPNNILIADRPMDDDQWCDLAFSLGLAARAGQRHSPANQRLAQKMRKRKVQSSSQTFDYVKPFIESLVAACPKLSQQSRHIWHSEAVPTTDTLKNTVHRLPTPKPAISIGYSRDSFSVSHDELQDGIIAGPTGEPCDLNRVSQPVAEHFWPFFVVEISENSMAAAQQASAVTAATCNHAVTLLAGAAADSEKDWNSTSFVFDRKFAKSFSLSIHDKVASLSAHGAQGIAPHIATEIARYRLDNEEEIASLADRLHNIMVWANYNRLGEIVASLDQLDRKVHGNLSGLSLKSDGYDFDPHCLKTMKLQAPRKPERMKVVLKAGLPSWLSR